MSHIGRFGEIFFGFLDDSFLHFLPRSSVDRAGVNNENVQVSWEIDVQVIPFRSGIVCCIVGRFGEIEFTT